MTLMAGLYIRSIYGILVCGGLSMAFRVAEFNICH